MPQLISKETVRLDICNDPIWLTGVVAPVLRRATGRHLGSAIRVAIAHQERQR
ncbi:MULTISPECIES: hypothetical protein [Sinorhizobium]|uniref:Uncharacterized protein n=1 Tax=Rhizobium fredii TaxID=380 RepID=A0A2L0H2L3_RHIFR|nr:MULTISPECIES: hypothetical protein [Sinorhizobium]AUX75690.1 hypothetical protein NXT3_CH01096 [Sinorhizobium fredii]